MTCLSEGCVDMFALGVYHDMFVPAVYNDMFV